MWPKSSKVLWCLLFALIFCPSFIRAQDKPDFTGIFLRTAVGRPDSKNEVIPRPTPSPPLLLEVVQTEDSLTVTQNQNGATSASHYQLKGGKTTNEDFDGVQTVSQARIKKGKLIIESSVIAVGGVPVAGDHRARIEQIWELSENQQTLTVRRPANASLEIFARQPTLERAMALADSASEMNHCNQFPVEVAERSTLDYSRGVLLGVTSYQQFHRVVIFDAGLGGPFFQGLVRKDTAGGAEFSRNGQRVEFFPDFVLAEIEPYVSPYSSGEAAPFVLPPVPPKIPEECLHLRFRLKWIGSGTRDLGEIGSELMTEPWPKERPPRRWYKVEVPAKNVPLTDTLEIQIFTSAGKRIGCISGHI